VVTTTVSSCADTTSSFVYAVSDSSPPGSITAATLVNTVFVYNTKSFMNSVCIPADPSYASKYGIGTVVAAGGVLAAYINEVAIHYDILLYMIAISFVLGFFFMIFLRIFAGIIIWCMILAYHGVLALLAYLFYVKSTDSTLDSVS